MLTVNVTTRANPMASACKRVIVKAEHFTYKFISLISNALMIESQRVFGK